MNVGRTVFSQLMDFIPMHDFHQAVGRHQGMSRKKRFSHWDQFLCMAFAQLTFRESLRDIEACLRSMSSTLYHCGIRGHIARSTLADANENRPWQIFHELALALIEKARLLYRNDKVLAELTDAVYAFDSTIVDLCLTLFPWAHAAGHVKTNAAIKLHTLLDLHTKIPTFVRISPANVHDMLMMDALIYEAGAFYVFDRGYMDFKRLKHIDDSKAFFVIRAKNHLRFTRLYSRPIDTSTGLRVDQTIKLDVWQSRQAYPVHLRRIKFFDREHDRVIVFLTNHFILDALVITQLYHQRWHIELFFKWIKQHLRIKAFFGTSPNAVRTQIWIAVSVYVLIAIVKKELHLEHSLYTILQILSVTLFQKEPISQVLTDTIIQTQNPHPANQLNLFNF